MEEKTMAERVTRLEEKMSALPNKLRVVNKFATMEDVENVREECTERESRLFAKTDLDKREIIDTIKANSAPLDVTKSYITAVTKVEESKIPVGRQIWQTIVGNKILGIIALLLSAALLRGLIGFLTELLSAVNQTIQYLRH